MAYAEVGFCAVCGKQFKKKGPLHKYCHWQCHAAYAKHAKQRSAEQLPAGRVEPAEAPTSVVCNAAGYESDNGDHQQQREPRGRYVYAWFNSDSHLPFYVGKGVGRRAWKRHLAGGRPSWCQTIRSSSSGFRVVIVRENLTNEGAMLLESSLIAFVHQCGGLVANQVDPLKRREVPPLFLESHCFTEVK